MEVITLETASLGDRSYLVHDGSRALVVDPQRDIDRVLAAASDAGVSIDRVLETHVHNDYVSGGLVLSRVTGAEQVHAGAEDLTFDHVGVEDGDAFSVGALAVEVLSTPGHTPHHLSYVVRHGDEPPAVFTGGSLLYGTVGRTDLIGDDVVDELTRAQHRSARRIADELPGDAKVFPTHGFGSFCASASSDEESDGTLETEKAVNLALTIDNEDEFVDRLVSGLSSYPRYYVHMGPLNRAGAVPADLAPPLPVDPTELARRIHRGEWVVDLRSRRVFAAEHLVGTIGVELADGFSTYVGWLMPWGTPLTLLADSPEEVTEAQRQLVRIGIDRPVAAGTGGPDAWAPDHERRTYSAVEFAEVPDTEGLILDVRREDERRSSHIVGSLHVPIDELLSRLDELPADETLLVHCASGFRAAIASSLLDRAGRDVVLIDDDYDKASKAGLDVVSPGSKSAP